MWKDRLRMTKVKKILCIYPEPAELRIAALLNRQGQVIDLTEVSRPEALRAAFEQPAWWDLILCDAESYYDLDVASLLDKAKERLDASLVLLKAPQHHLTPSEGYRRGAADLVVRGDMDHLLMVCEREIKNCRTRKQLRDLRYSAGSFEGDSKSAFVLATINDLSRTMRSRQAEKDSVGADGSHQPDSSLNQPRLKSLIDNGGLTLEYQPIVSFKANEEHRNMFETLVRLKDEAGRLLLPDTFLPALAELGWMSKIDLWIFRQAISVLEEMHAGGARDAILFVNVATETLLSEQAVRAIGAFASAAHLSPGSIVVEVRKAAFKEAPDGLSRLASMLQVKQHGLLVEDPKLDDCAFLEAHRGLITHVKLSRSTTQGLVEGGASQSALNGFVRCAHKEGIRVIALAVDSIQLMPMLYGAGIDAIQGNFMSMPNRDLVYPSVQRIDSGAATVPYGADSTD